MSWERPFDQPIPLPRPAAGANARDAGNYIKKLPRSDRDTAEWRIAIQMLIDAAEDRGPVLFAKVGMDRALDRTRHTSSAAAREREDFAASQLKRMPLRRLYFR
jgi:hypothetical protein